MTYSVLTRLPGDARVSRHDAVLLIDENFTEALTLSPHAAGDVHRVLARSGVLGVATYDGLVALAADHRDAQERGVTAARDAVHAATALAHGVPTLLGSGTDFDAVPGITRIAPSALA